MGKKTNTMITFIIFAFTLLSLILLVLVCISTPITDKLHLSQLYDGDGRLLINMGLLGACAKATDEGADYTRGANCQRKSMGYYVRPIFQLNSPDPTRRQGQIELLNFEETWPLILVPLVAGLSGVNTILFVIASLGRTKRWMRTLHIIIFCLQVLCTLIAWVAFGMCIRMTPEINRSLDDFHGWPAIPLPLVAKYGNAVWLALVAAILLLVSTVLYGVKIFGAPAKSEAVYRENRKDVELDQVASQ